MSSFLHVSNIKNREWFCFGKNGSGGVWSAFKETTALVEAKNAVTGDEFHHEALKIFDEYYEGSGKFDNIGFRRFTDWLNPDGEYIIEDDSGGILCERCEEIAWWPCMGCIWRPEKCSILDYVGYASGRSKTYPPRLGYCDQHELEELQKYCKTHPLFKVEGLPSLQS